MKPVLSISPPRAAIVLAVCALAFCGQGASAQGVPTTKFLEGVWKITKVVNADAADTHPQPSLQIFYGNYFSIVRDISSDARPASPPPKDPKNLTDAEKLARYQEWAPFGASAGTFEIKGDIIVTHAIVAKNVGGTKITEEAVIQKIDDDTFMTTPRPGQPNAGRQTTYSRVH